MLRTEKSIQNIETMEPNIRSLENVCNNFNEYLIIYFVVCIFLKFNKSKPTKATKLRISSTQSN